MSKVSWASSWACDFIGLKIIIEFSSSKKRCEKAVMLFHLRLVRVKGSSQFMHHSFRFAQSFSLFLPTHLLTMPQSTRASTAKPPGNLSPLPSPSWVHTHVFTWCHFGCVWMSAFPFQWDQHPPPSSSQEEPTPQWSRQGAAENKPLSIEEEEGACREGRWYPPPSSSCLFLSLFFSPHCFPFLFFSLVSFLSFLSFVYTSNSTPPPLSLYH